MSADIIRNKRCPFCGKPIGIMKYRSLAKLTEGYCHNESHHVKIIGILIEALEAQQ